MWITLGSLLLFGCGVAQGWDEGRVHSEEFILEVNQVQDSWRAGRNFQPASYVKNLLSVLPPREEQLPLKTVKIRKDLPKNFDGRKAWKRCRSVGKVNEQGNCASAWALVAAKVFTDRMCVAKVETVEISGQNVLSCCKICGTNCFGGYVSDALQFLVRKGAPSKRCHPYEIPVCPKPRKNLDCSQGRALNPRCRVNCRKTFSKNPFQDTRRASNAYSVSNSSDAIRSEIMTWGPVAAVVDLYEDFLVYKSGVYSHVTGDFLAQHPVTVLGWGVEEQQPYWLVLNSWGPVWGNRGVIKIAVDFSGVRLENRVFAVDPEPV